MDIPGQSGDPRHESPHDGRSRSVFALPGDALIEVVVRRRLGVRVELAVPGRRHLPERRSTGRRHGRCRGGFAQVRKDVAHNRRLGDEGPAAPAADWIAGNGRLFADALNVAVNETAENLVHELMLLYYRPPHVLAAADRAPVPAFMLRPVRPPVERRFDLRGAFLDRHRGGWGALAYAYADGVRPQIEWEAFPRRIDFADDASGAIDEAIRVSQTGPAGGGVSEAGSPGVCCGAASGAVPVRLSLRCRFSSCFFFLARSRWRFSYW